MARQVIRIGPRGGRIVSEAGQRKQYESKRPESPRRASQMRLLDEPRRLQLRPPEPTAPRRRERGRQGDLFSGPEKLPPWAKERRGVEKVKAQVESAKTQEDRPRRITEGDPSVHGSHLLGHEGETHSRASWERAHQASPAPSSPKRKDVWHRGWVPEWMPTEQLVREGRARAISGRGGYAYRVDDNWVDGDDLTREQVFALGGRVRHRDGRLETPRVAGREKLEAQVAAAKDSASKPPIKRGIISFGTTSRGIGLSKGDIIRGRDGNAYRVTETESDFVPEDGLSFGLPDDQGWSHTVKLVPATEKEAQDLRGRESAVTEHTQAQKKASELRRRFLKDGEYPEGQHTPSGDLVLEAGGVGARAYGGGSWYVISDDAIWHVQNNGGDGDDWSHNNVRTGGAGAIGYRLPKTKELERTVRQLDETLASPAPRRVPSWNVQKDETANEGDADDGTYTPQGALSDGRQRSHGGLRATRIGNRVHFTGDTYHAKGALRQLGARWDRDRKSWHLPHDDYVQLEEKLHRTGKAAGEDAKKERDRGGRRGYGQAYKGFDRLVTQIVRVDEAKKGMDRVREQLTETRSALRPRRLPV